MGDSNSIFEHIQLKSEVLSDDLPDWVDLEEETTGTSENRDTGGPSHHPEDDDQSSDIDNPAAQSESLRLKITKTECEDCGETILRNHHRTCTAPIIYIGGEWRCGECGMRSSPQGSCSCGASVDREPTEIPLNMSINANPDEIEKAVHRETNRRRANNNIGKLEYSQHLSAIALQHSRAMAQREFIAHSTPDGEEPIDRYRKFGHDDRSCGENIALIYPDQSASREEAAQMVVDDWMDSPGHRENILAERFRMEGIGIYLDPDGAMYATQNFY